MANPFKNRAASLHGPVTDIQPVVPNDAGDLPEIAVALYIEMGGTLSITTVSGQSRTLEVTDFSLLPVGVSRVRATGTTASGIHAMVLA
jgi:hypothetical protein